MGKDTATDPVLDEIVRRVAALHPNAQIILFGSRATGTYRPDSDYDLLIITPDVRPDQSASVPIRAALRGIGVGLDLLVLTPAQWATMRTMRNSVVREASETGQVLRAAA